jgi:hypothetical protein
MCRRAAAARRVWAEEPMMTRAAEATAASWRAIDGTATAGACSVRAWGRPGQLRLRETEAQRQRADRIFVVLGSATAIRCCGW